MARSYAKNDKAINYAAAVRALKEQGPGRLYILHGKEDYLREKFLEELKKICLPEGEDSFSFKRIDGPELDPYVLQSALDSVPFLSERSFVELRNIDLNKIKPSEKFIDLFSDIPDYCTVAIVLKAEYELDGRLKLNKKTQRAGTGYDVFRSASGSAYKLGCPPFCRRRQKH